MYLQTACETFCLDTEETFSNAALALQEESLTIDTVRLINVIDNTPLEKQLTKYHNKKAVVCKLKNGSKNLHRNASATERSTILVEIIANDVSKIFFTFVWFFFYVYGFIYR